MLNIRKKKNNSIYWGDSNSYDFGTILTFYARNHVFLIMNYFLQEKLFRNGIRLEIIKLLEKLLHYLC